MQACFCSSNPQSTSISKFISNQPYLSMLENKCQTIKDLKIVHAQLIKTGLVNDIIAASRVLSFAATSPARDMNYALQFFTHIDEPNLFSWNTIIRGFCQSSTPQVAVFLFIDMLESASAVEPEKRTYPSVFKAYTQLGLANDGAQLHGRVIKLGMDSDPFIRNSIINMYASCGLLGHAMNLFDEDGDLDVVTWNSVIMGFAKCGEIDESWRLFHKMPFRNEISWNSMISGCVRNGRWSEALNLFKEMQEMGIRPTEYTLVSALNACGKLGTLEQGKWIHDYIKNNGIELHPIVVNSIIDMYSKCGSIELAREVFENAPRKGLACWNSMMLGLATNCFEEEAIQLFAKLTTSNLRPDPVSFIGILAACNHSGQADKAREIFRMMVKDYGIEPLIEHYGCMIDILGRAGLIEEALEVIRRMPMNPDTVIWGSLLSSCLSYGNVGVAEWAKRNLIVSDPNDTSAHVLMSNLYAVSGDSERAMSERVLMKRKMKEKQPGGSLIEVNGEVHGFLAAAIHDKRLIWNVIPETEFDSVIPFDL